jgi:hypothetical protein
MSHNFGHGLHEQGKSSLSFVVRSTDDAIMRTNLLASPCLQRPSPHQVIAIRNAPSAAAGLNAGIARASHDLVVCLHQDVFLPAGWDRLATNQYRLAEREVGPIGVAGVYGVGAVRPYPGSTNAFAAERIGCVVDRGRTLSEGPALPAPVATLDELVLIVRRDTPLRFDPELGFHLYGADLCLQARELGMVVVALGAPCHHRSRSIGLPGAFFGSAEAFARKWAHRLPIATPCVVFDREGQVRLLGNADNRAGSIARGRGLLPRQERTLLAEHYRTERDRGP